MSATFSIRQATLYKGNVHPQIAANSVLSILQRLQYEGLSLSKANIEAKFTAVGIDSAARLNMAEALLRTKDINPAHAKALDILNQTYGLDHELAQRAARHQEDFFSIGNLRSAQKLYVENGGQGNFFQEIRNLSEVGGSNQRKALVVAVLATSYAKQLGLDPQKFDLKFFMDRPELQGFQSNQVVNINVNTTAWHNQFAKIINTTSHEINHADQEVKAEAYKNGKIPPTHPDYLYAKACAINLASYIPPQKGQAAYENQLVETSSNMVGHRFELAARSQGPSATTSIRQDVYALLMRPRFLVQPVYDMRLAA